MVASGYSAVAKLAGAALVLESARQEWVTTVPISCDSVASAEGTRDIREPRHLRLGALLRSRCPDGPEARLHLNGLGAAAHGTSETLQVGFRDVLIRLFSSISATCLVTFFVDCAHLIIQLVLHFVPVFRLKLQFSVRISMQDAYAQVQQALFTLTVLLDLHENGYGGEKQQQTTTDLGTYEFEYDVFDDGRDEFTVVLAVVADGAQRYFDCAWRLRDAFRKR